ncbi:hypothetical protein [Bradyrhizobium sp. 159]|uniref:hypothetical protein n=1 Tax=Bradyrhizobium sp. 159 TaxID=2782632 RepID=UPI001FF72A12|nr:hypothetical protein [Bradyrhizobium sp. 159]
MHVPGRRGRLDGLKSTHIDHVILLKQAGKNSHEHICQSLELFGREVMPELQNDPAQAAWKQGAMNGEIKLADIDTQAFTDRCGQARDQRRGGEGGGGLAGLCS